MSGFSGINQFGSLTTQSGQKLTFKDFDKDGDGKITQEEYDTVMNEMKLDSVELSSVDKNGDKEISEDEFAQWEQKILMQDAINELKAQISKDFSGTASKFISEVTDALKTYLEVFAQNYTNDISGMAKDFENTLPNKYEEIKGDCLKNDSTTVKSEVLDELVEGLASKTYSDRSIWKSRRGKAVYDEETLLAIGKKLETAADGFIKSYKGDNLREDLKTYLNDYLNTPDTDKMQDAAATYRETFSAFGIYVDSNELTELKEAVKEFLKTALNKGITVMLGNTEIKSESAITNALKKFEDAQTLNDAIETIITNLNELNLANATKKELNEKAVQEKEQAFKDIKGSEYAIDANLIDFTNIDGYANNKEIFQTSAWCGKSGAKMGHQTKAIKVLDNITIREQMRSQIEDMLNSKGFDTTRINGVFDNVYNDSMYTAVEQVQKYYEGGYGCNTQELVDTFIKVFNKNIKDAIDEINACDTDMDIQDLPYPKIDFQIPKDLKTDFYLNLLKKAEAMCEANGITFNVSVFDTMYNNVSLGLKMTKRSDYKTLASAFKTNYTNWVEKQKLNEH